MQRQHNFLFACDRQKFDYNSIGEIAYQIDGSFRHNSIEGGIVCLIRLKTIVPPYIELNPSASLLWEALAQPKTAAELAAALQSAYGIAPEQARADVQEFLELLVQHEMVVAP